MTGEAATYASGVSVLRAESLVKSYDGRPVVKGISMAVSAGEIIGLLGRNGAGKTTTFRMIAGLERPEGGRLELDGEDISRRTASERAARGIAYLPQETSVFLKTSVAGNLRLVLELRLRSKAEREARLERLLDDMRLTSLSRRSAHALSGGERRRLEIARALVLDPKFLLLDEPFTGIDPLTIQDLQKIFMALRNRGIGLVVSDHNVRDTFAIVSRAMIIDEGRVLAEGRPAALAADETVQRRFLGNLVE